MKLFIHAGRLIVAYSNKPLVLSIVIGFTITALAFIIGCILIYLKLSNTVALAGWVSTVVSIYFIGGLILANMGIMGIYLGNTLNQTKGRPIYIVGQTTGGDNPDDTANATDDQSTMDR